MRDAVPVVDVRGAAKTYRNGTVALAPVDVSVRAGEFVTLLGPSGCGKTTLLNLIAGLIAPSAGTLAWWGRPTIGDDPDRRIACVFQSPTLMPWSRIATNVRLPLDLAGSGRASAEAAVRDALALVGLERFGRHFPRELSGGMQMRASIARALVTSPALLLMDEPFGALDEFTRERLDDELSALWQARQMTIVFVTHSIVEAVYLSTRIVVMGPRPGRVIDGFDVPEPHPRGERWRTSPEFARLHSRIAERVNAAGLATLDGC